jgi:hypothetical protein
MMVSVTAVMELMNLILAQLVPTHAEKWELQLVKKTSAGIQFFNSLRRL